MVTKEQVMEALGKCYDPEIPMSIVELGLIYGVDIKDNAVGVKMTLTTPGCGMGAFIAQEAKAKIEDIEGVSEATIDIVWDPPWTPEKMNKEAKKRLGFA